MSDHPSATKGRQTLTLRVDARGRGYCAIDGLEISHSVVGVELKTDVDHGNEVTIRFSAVNLDVEAAIDEVRQVGAA